jgi:acyl-coenzyme A synthetase/AMP-(fatty) acid ligase
VAACGEAWNMFGPTETTVWSTCHRLRSGGPVLIGKPIANTQVHVLDAAGRQLPFGVTGELVIGGCGVAQGYFGQPGLTAERFVPDPGSDVRGARMYRTGDRVRLLPEGLLYLGRDDQQVKLRGHRIEFGELESALASHASVAQCAATVLELDAQDRRLVAYVVPSEGCDADAGALRDSLRSSLPEYLVPQHIVFLPELPTTPNGKLDRRALPPPGPGDATLAPVVVEPESLLEQLLVDVWCAEPAAQRRDTCSQHHACRYHQPCALHI